MRHTEQWRANIALNGAPFCRRIRNVENFLAEPWLATSGSRHEPRESIVWPEYANRQAISGGAGFGYTPDPQIAESRKAGALR